MNWKFTKSENKQGEFGHLLFNTSHVTPNHFANFASGLNYSEMQLNIPSYSNGPQYANRHDEHRIRFLDKELDYMTESEQSDNKSKHLVIKF